MALYKPVQNSGESINFFFTYSFCLTPVRHVLDPQETSQHLKHKNMLSNVPTRTSACMMFIANFKLVMYIILVIQ